MPLQIPSPRSRKHARIEIIPLIDIIFFLLATFVMVSLSMVQNKGIPVNLPVAASGTPQDRKEFTTITVTEKGEVFYDKQPIALEDLDGALKSLLAGNPEPKVFINGDAKAEFGKAIEVLDHVRKMGITKIAIETKPQGAAASPATPTAPPAPAPTESPAPSPSAPPATPPANR
jgi:biopolymer transport protein ExbD